MSALGNLVVSLIMDTAAFTKGIDKSTNEAQKFAKEMDQKVNKALQNAAGGMKSFAGNALGAIGVATTVAAAFSKLENTFQQLDAAVKQSQSLGIAIQDMTALQFAAKLSGVEVDKFGDGLKDFNKNIAEAAGGSKSQAEMFKALGISVVDASGKVRTTQDVLLELSDQFANFKDGPEKSAAAMKLFGDSGVKLIPFLNQGREGIEDLTSEARRLGVVMDDETAKAAEQFGDDITRLNAVSDALFINLSRELLPTLQSVTEKMLDATKVSDGLGQSFATMLNELFSTGSIDKKLEDLGSQVGNSSIFDLGSDFLKGERQNQIKAQVDFNIIQLEKQNDAAIKAFGGYSILNEALGKNAETNDKSGKSGLGRLKGLLTQGEAAKKFAEIEKNRQKLLEENFRIEKDIQAMFDDVLQEEADRNDEAKKRAEALAKENQVMREQIEEIGLSSEALLALRQSRLEDAAASKEQAAARLEGRAGYDFEIEQLKEEARLLRERAGLLGEEDVANQSKAARDAAIALRDENQKVFDQFTDGMLDAFGKVRLEGVSLAESLSRAFESEFEKLILRPVIKAAFEGGDIGSAIGKGFDTYNDVFNRAFTNPLGNAGVSAASSFAMSGAGRSLGLSESAVYSALDGATGDLTAAGLQFTQAAAVIGKAAPYFSAVSNAISGNYGASIGAGIGAYFGGPAGAFIGEMIGDKLLGGLFGGNKISAQDLSADQLKPISDAVTLGFTDFIKMFEGTGTANFMVSGNTGRQGENPNFTLSTDGYSSRERFAGDGLFARGEIALNEQNVAEEVSRAMFAALQRSDFADNIDQVFDSLDPLSASFAELNFALEGARVLDAVNDSFGKLPGNLAALSGASLETLQAFSNAVGGFENLGNSVAQFNQQFLSEDERLRLEIDLLGSTVKQLGVEVPQTRDEFRKLVEAQDLTQQAGIRAYGSLLQMSGAVDQVFDQLEARAEQAAEESRRASEKAAEDARRIADEQTAQAQAIANQRIGLENQIMQLLGDTAGLRERELAALDPANRFLQAHIYALQDAARAQQERNQALEIERQALERVVNLGKSIADYVRGLSITDPTLSPQQRLQNSSSEFNRLLTLAQGGDENALQQITGASDQFLNAAREFYGSTGPFQGILENVKDALLDLPAVETYEQQTISLLKDLVAQFAAFNDVVTIDIAVLAESEITKAIKFVSDTDLLPPDLKQLALADTLPSVTRTVAAILGDDGETQMVKRLALDTLGASVKTINGAFGNDAETVAVKTFTIGQLASTQKTITAILANDATTQEAKRLALEGLGVGQRFIEAIIASSTAPTLKSLLLDDTSVIARAFAISATVDRTKSDPALIDAVLNESSSYALKLDVALADGLISADERLVLETQKGVVDKTVNALASGGNLTEDQRAIIRAVSGTVGQTVEASVAFANSLSPDGGILAYGRAEVAAAYFANGKYLSQWLSDIAAYTMWSAGHLEVIRNLAANGAVVVRSENRSGSAVGFFADGGLVTGPGGPRSDSIAAYLSNREYVMPNSAVEQFGVGFMDNIKKGMMPVMPVPYMSNNGMNMGEVVAAVKGLQTQFRDLGQQISNQPLNMNVSVVTPDGRVLVEKTITQIQDRARRGDFKIDTRALGV